MKRILIIGVSALALSACGGEAARNTAADAGNLASATESKMEDTAGAAVGAGGAMAASNTAADYVTNAALGDMYEVESSKLALDKSQSAGVKKFAQQMVADHTATTKKLKDAIAEAKLDLTPPAALDARRQGMLDNLKGAATAADFDRAYLDQQTAAHSEALTLHKGFAEDGDNDVLKKLAGETAPKIQHHFDMVKQLDAGGADGTH